MRSRSRQAIVARLVALLALLATARAHALPVELKDQNGTKYNINTDVDPLLRNSEASGAITNATYVKPVTVTSYFVGLTPFGFFLTTYTVQRQVNIPLTNAFAGFNGLLITGADGVALPSPLVFNPGEGLASQDCTQNNENRELIFQTQTFPAPVNLTVTRKVFVPGQLRLRPLAQHRDQHGLDAAGGGHHAPGAPRLGIGHQGRHHLERRQRPSRPATSGSPADSGAAGRARRPSPRSDSSSRATAPRRRRAPPGSTASDRRSSPTRRRSPRVARSSS